MKLSKLDKRIWLKGLALECPLSTPMQDCPLNGIRCLPHKQVALAVNHLSDETVDAIAEYHRHCYVGRVKELAASVEESFSSSTYSL